MTTSALDLVSEDDFPLELDEEGDETPERARNFTGLVPGSTPGGRRKNSPWDGGSSRTYSADPQPLGWKTVWLARGAWDQAGMSPEKVAEIAARWGCKVRGSK